MPSFHVVLHLSELVTKSHQESFSAQTHTVMQHALYSVQQCSGRTAG